MQFNTHWESLEQSARYDAVYSRLGLGLHVDNGSEGRGNKEKLHRGGLCNRGRWGVWNGEFWVEELLFLTQTFPIYASARQKWYSGEKSAM